LLDGLDEVAKEHRVACIDAVNTFLSMYTVPTVMCSRRADYFALPRYVQLRNAIAIEPLTAKQIALYLSSAGKPLEAVRMVLYFASLEDDLTSAERIRVA